MKRIALLIVAFAIVGCAPTQSEVRFRSLMQRPIAEFLANHPDPVDSAGVRVGVKQYDKDLAERQQRALFKPKPAQAQVK